MNFRDYKRAATRTPAARIKRAVESFDGSTPLSAEFQNDVMTQGEFLLRRINQIAPNVLTEDGDGLRAAMTVGPSAVVARIAHHNPDAFFDLVEDGTITREELDAVMESPPVEVVSSDSSSMTDDELADAINR